jgi:hypothetical protein
MFQRSPPFADGMAGALWRRWARRGWPWWRSCCPLWSTTRSVPWTARTRLPSGREAELCDVVPETQPFTSVTWLVVRMVVPDLPGPGAGPSAPTRSGLGLWRDRASPGGGNRIRARAHRRATDGGALHPGRARAGDNSIHRGLHAARRCLHLGAFVMQIQDFAPRSSCGLQSEASESQANILPVEKPVERIRARLSSTLAAEPQLYLGSWPGSSARSRTGGPKTGTNPADWQVLSRTLPLAGRGIRLVRLFHAGRGAAC